MVTMPSTRSVALMTVSANSLTAAREGEKRVLMRIFSACGRRRRTAALRRRASQTQRHRPRTTRYLDLGGDPADVNRPNVRRPLALPAGRDRFVCRAGDTKQRHTSAISRLSAEALLVRPAGGGQRLRGKREAVTLSQTVGLLTLWSVGSPTLHWFAVSVDEIALGLCITLLYDDAETKAVRRAAR